MRKWKSLNFPMSRKKQCQLILIINLLLTVFYLINIEAQQRELDNAYKQV